MVSTQAQNACHPSQIGVRGSLRFADKSLVQSRQIEAMAQVHRLLHAHAPACPELVERAASDPAQMALF